MFPVKTNIMPKSENINPYREEKKENRGCSGVNPPENVAQRRLERSVFCLNGKILTKSSNTPVFSGGISNLLFHKLIKNAGRSLQLTISADRDRPG